MDGKAHEFHDTKNARACAIQVWLGQSGQRHDGIARAKEIGCRHNRKRFIPIEILLSITTRRAQNGVLVFTLFSPLPLPYRYDIYFTALITGRKELYA